MATDTEHPFGDEFSGFQRDLLYVVADMEESYGLGIRDRLEDEYGGTEVHHGRLYTDLDTLIDRGLVEKGPADRRTGTYQITDDGREQVAARAEWWRGEQTGGRS